MLLQADISTAQLIVPFVALPEGPALGAGAILTGGTGDDAVLQDALQTVGDEWIVPLLSGASSGAVAAGMFSLSEDVLLDRQSPDDEQEPDIIITGTRYTGRAYNGEGSGGGSGGSGGTGGSTSGYTAGVEQHTPDCGTEDGAATQVANHVIGELPAGVSGPEDPVTTSNGNDWTKVEFGAVIVRNPDGSFGALNNMIYSSNQAFYVGLPDSSGQPVQGLWHSHVTRDGEVQRAIDRYPSPGDWNALARIGGQSGAVTDPSLWITGPDGVTREFKLSERSSIESLGDEQMKDGEGLAGKERTQSCG